MSLQKQMLAMTELYGYVDSLEKEMKIFSNLWLLPGIRILFLLSILSSKKLPTATTAKRTLS